MRYPTVTRTVCDRIATQLLAGAVVSVEPDVNWLGTGDDLDLTPIRGVAAEINDGIDTFEDPADRDRYEGLISPRLFEALTGAAVLALDDPGFWRYLSVGHFWSFISWREQDAFQRGNHMRYIDGQNATETVLTRMYLRAAALGGVEHGDLAGALTRSTDFWRSHVLRVRTASSRR